MDRYEEDVGRPVRCGQSGPRQDGPPRCRARAQHGVEGAPEHHRDQTVRKAHRPPPRSRQQNPLSRSGTSTV
ncbi:hypothetical protein ACFTZM_31820, partial [Streptomyces hydrogenans]|uniref:hypothetical protein n=1 Tax=Streptomyces hydrogenans TaxID=1873719 RepID=UPI0036451B2A